MRPYFISLLIGALTLSPLVAFAQFDMGNTGSSFTMSVLPQYPEPLSQTTLSVTSSSLNLANAIMAVSVNGKEIYKGSVQPIAIPVGKAGSATNVQVSITTNGSTTSQSLSIQAQDVTLIAEPLSSAPPLYAGKPLIPLDGNVRVVAMADLRTPEGKIINPSSCSYVWTVDNTQEDDFSGIGKNTLIVSAPLQYRARTVSVTVESQDGSVSGSATMVVSPEEPSLRIYRVDPLLGVLFDHALSDTYTITGAEDTFYAAPFSFSLTNGTPTIQWLLNGQPAQSGDTITMRPSGNGQGSALASVSASVGEVQTSTNLSLSFGSNKSGFNLFGL